MCVCVCVCVQVEKLDNLIHNEIERKAEVERARNCMMMVVARVVTFALQTIAIILKLISVLRYHFHTCTNSRVCMCVS